MRATVVTLSILILLSSSLGEAQSSPAQINLSAPEGIIHQLAPDEAAPARVDIDPAQRARVIQLLSGAKRDETGWHKELAIYFLICLDRNYSENIRDLLRIFHNPKNENPESTLDLIIKTYRQGHPELLKTLLKAGPPSEGALAEQLGTFFEEDLQAHPRQFVSALSEFSVADQKSICLAAGGTDGGGLPPGAEVRIFRNLAAFHSGVARRCALNVRDANRDAKALSQE